MALNFGGAIESQDRFIPVGYRSNVSGQTEFSAHSPDINAHTDLYTVPTGRTAYVYDLIFSSTNAANNVVWDIDNGTSDVLATVMAQTLFLIQIHLSVPLKFTAGQVIGVDLSNYGGNDRCTIVGFTE